MKLVFDSKLAEGLVSTELDEARAYLLKSLRQFTKLPLEFCGAETTIHCTNVHTVPTKEIIFSLSWEGIIVSSDYRDDGILVYGAYLFPLIDRKRSCLARIRDDQAVYDYAFRYLMLTMENGWEDRGWKIDENEEFKDWYIE